MTAARPKHPVMEHQPVWVLSSHTIAEAEEVSLWNAVRQARDLHTGPGPFVLAIDGRSGSGKSGFAERLRARAAAQDGAGSVALFHLENLYPGWDGLAQGVDLWAEMLGRLLEGRDAPWHAWDWSRNRQDPEERILTADVPLVIAEGVGASAPGHHERRPHFGVWLHLEQILRKARALRRDGDLYRPHWDRWAAQEDRLFAQ